MQDKVKLRERAEQTAKMRSLVRSPPEEMQEPILYFILILLYYTLTCSALYFDLVRSPLIFCTYIILILYFDLVRSPPLRRCRSLCDLFYIILLYHVELIVVGYLLATLMPCRTCAPPI